MSRELIYWHQSLFLQPQHFQIVDRRTGMLFRDGLRLWADYPYGLSRLKISADSLAAGIFQLDELEMLTPDLSERVRLPEEAVCPSRPLPLDFGADDRLMIHLGFRAAKAGEPAATLAENDDEARAIRTRYLAPADPTLEPDIHSGGPEAELRFLKIVIKVIFEPELDDYGDYATLPVARIIREGGGVFRLDDSYFPPCLNLAACQALHDLVRSVRDRLTAKTRNLEISKSTSGTGVETLTMLLALQTLAVSAVRLDNLLSVPQTTAPWEVYGLFREMMAALSIFSLDLDFTGADRRDLREPRPYLHNDPAPGLIQLRESIFRVLDSLSSGPRYLVRFDWHEPYFVAELPGHMIDEGREFWLIIKTPEGSDREATAERAARYLKLASREGLPLILAQAVGGIPVTRVQPPPAQLPKGPDLIYFRIHHESRLWDEVVKSGLVCAYWDEAGPDTEFQVAVLTGGGL
ncbi:MAG: type VI secretion system baseplate subunit TssK [Candidatus Adiutrix sp.]|jgi:type VI secretion system protein ImpJ|nr:type VI secretion system baseplate subunit TssK [Candidatus Adiutrix sp.]